MKSETEMTSAPSAELYQNQPGAAWYCVRTQLKHEHIAAAHLRRMMGVEVFHPQLRLLRSTRQGRRWFVESLFPNYIFARFGLETMWEKIAYTPGVKVVLRFGGQATEIPEAVIEDLRGEVAGLGDRVLTDAPTEGTEVEIAGGAFAGMTASVTRLLPGRQRAEILVEVMGRLVPTELSLDLVLFDRQDAAQFALPRVEPPPVDEPGRLAPVGQD